MWEWTPEQQEIVDRINSGQTDFKFGPGSPNPTHEDLHTYVGGKFSPAGGFAVEGGVALAPKEYNMFTSEQRKALGIMDIAPKDQAGKIERYYGFPGTGGPQFASNNAPAPVSGGQYAVGTTAAPRGGGFQPMPEPVPSQTGQQVGGAFTGLGNALAQLGQAQARQGQIGTSQAMALLQQRRPSGLSQFLPAIGSYMYG